MTMNGDNVTIRNSVICTNPTDDYAVAFDYLPQSLNVQNCVFLGFHKIFNLTGYFPFTFQNNIAYDWSPGGWWGNYPSGSEDISYNASSSIDPPGTNGITLSANPFVNYSTTNHFSIRGIKFSFSLVVSLY